MFHLAFIVQDNTLYASSDHFPQIPQAGAIPVALVGTHLCLNTAFTLDNQSTPEPIVTTAWSSVWHLYMIGLDPVFV